MKRVLPILVLLLMCASGVLYAKPGVPGKITADLTERINKSSNSDELIPVIIVMNDQYDATKNVRQTQFLDKSQRRAFVINELKRIADDGQVAIVNELQQGQRSSIVSDIHQLWIINGICCSMTKDMIYAIANRSDIGYIMSDVEVCIPDGEDDEEVTNPTRGIQWNVSQVNADDVWSLGYTGNGVIVAVIDSGVEESLRRGF